jgi:ParB-like chromosome segregation protein Spo0J
MMLDHEFEDLKKGIRASGLQEPITLYKDKVLDGRNRLRACQELGIEPQFKKAEFEDDQTALDFVIAHNLQRRNLTASQKAVVALRALPLIKKEVQEARIQKIREAIAAKTLDGKGANLPSSEETETRRGRKKEIKTTSIVGDLFGVSATYVRYAEALRKKDESLLDKVIVDGRRLYDLYKEECPDDVKSRTKLGRPADPIRTTLSKVIRLVTASNDMPDVLKQLTGAMESLESIRAAARQEKDEAAMAAKEAKAAKKPAPAARKGKKPAKK